jgi:hypothetical protein
MDFSKSEIKQPNEISGSIFSLSYDYLRTIYIRKNTPQNDGLRENALILADKLGAFLGRPLNATLHSNLQQCDSMNLADLTREESVNLRGIFSKAAILLGTFSDYIVDPAELADNSMKNPDRLFPAWLVPEITDLSRFNMGMLDRIADEEHAIVRDDDLDARQLEIADQEKQPLYKNLERFIEIACEQNGGVRLFDLLDEIFVDYNLPKGARPYSENGCVDDESVSKCIDYPDHLIKKLLSLDPDGFYYVLPKAQKFLKEIFRDLIYLRQEMLSSEDIL